MEIKPFVSINFCYKCRCPVPRVGLSIKTGVGNILTTTPFLCINCKRKTNNVSFDTTLSIQAKDKDTALKILREQLGFTISHCGEKKNNVKIEEIP